jgi:ligand-binding sensor domain-containing protein/serine phosphatase RsbU (regulator of sigma subunit)
MHIAGEKVNLRETMPPIVNQARKPVSVPAYRNEYDFKKPTTSRPVNADVLTSITFGNNPDAGVLTNSTGDTVITGIPYPVKGETHLLIHPKPVIARPFRVKDNALKNIKYLDVDQGLNSSEISCILEDRRGNMWFGGSGAGVSMYNGVSFKHFTREEGLSSNDVHCILEDPRGNIWFGTGWGLNRYDGDSITWYLESDGLSSHEISELMLDSRGNLWIGTDEGGVIKYDGESFINLTEIEGMSGNSIPDMLEDRQGNLWFITWGGGATRFDGETFTHFRAEDGMHNNYLISVVEDDQGNIWFGTDDGAAIYDGESFTYITEDEGFSSRYIMADMKDRQGNLWFGTNGGGINKFDGEKFQHFTEKEGLSSNFAHFIYQDSRDNIWIGTNGGGVSLIPSANDFIHFTDQEGLSNSVVFSLMEDSKGILWFGTRGGGVNMYDGKSFRHLTTDQGLGNDYVLSLMEDGMGSMWFGTYGNGISRHAGEIIVVANHYHGFSDYSINCMHQDRNGEYWFGTYRGGMTRFNGQDFFHYTEEQGLGSSYVTSIMEDSRGNLWFTTGAGVSMLMNDTIIHYSPREGLLSNSCKALMEDRHGNIWIGGTKGISVFTGDAFIQYTEKEGLVNNNVTSIKEYNGNEVWVGTQNGLNRFIFGGDDWFDMKDNGEPEFPLLISYGKQEGLRGINFYHSSVIDRNNRLWYGSGKNLTMLDLNSFKVPSEAPAVSLDGIEVKEQALDYRSCKDSGKLRMAYSGVAGFGNYPMGLEIPHRNNHLTFYFSGIDWSAPQKVRYSYKIEGVDDDWSTSSSEAKADYRNLPYGTHTFKVCAIGEAQQWSDPSLYTFTVLPPWYHTWLARIAYLISAVVLVFGFVRWRTAQLHERQKDLETKIHHATKEIKDKKDEVEAQRDEIAEHRNKLERQRDLVMAQKEEITDSINYAQRIQTAALPDTESLEGFLSDHFVLFKPRDIVSGDFYWIKQIKNFLYIVVADCTGHGVPGAFMSMLGISLLNEQVGRSRLDPPGEILDRLRRKVKGTLAQEGMSGEQKDGMDMALITFDRESRELQYAGAFNPLYLIRGKEKLDADPLKDHYSLDSDKYQLIEFKADRQPIAVYAMEKDFTTRPVQLISGDTVYLFSDGFPDQIGGERGKKMLIKNFKRLLLSVQDLPMSEQKEKLEQTLEEWQGEYEQVDDIIVMGLRV